MKFMKKNLLLLALVCMTSFATSCAGVGNAIVPSKNYVTKKVKVGKFDGIATATSIDVVYTQTSGEQNIEVSAPDNLMEYVSVVVDDNILKVRFRNKNSNEGISIDGKHKTVVRVSAPAVHGFRASSSGDITLTNGLKTTGKVAFKSSSSGDIESGSVKCDELIIQASSSGDVELSQTECRSLDVEASSSGDVSVKNITAEQVQADASSAGDVALSGVCRTADFSASSSGDIEAKNLKADVVKARASSAGDVTCHAVESLTAETSSAGSVNYKGNPQIQHLSKRGLNKID